MQDDQDLPQQDGESIEELLAACLLRLESEGADALQAFLAEHPESAAVLEGHLVRLVDAGLLTLRGASRPDGETWGAPVSSDDIGPYRIIEELGRGGQGLVYLAEDTRLGRKVALKVLTSWGAPSEQEVARFRREATVASKLDHPGICTVYETGTAQGVPYLAMRYVEGESLANKISTAVGGSTPDTMSFVELTEAADTDADGAFTDTVGQSTQVEVVRVARLVENAARALHAAHEAGVIHRDIKPGNIMVGSDGDPVILDFGLAREYDGDEPTLTRTGDLFGTPAYMAPEQLMAQRIRVDRRADVWALGVTLYESLALKRPFDSPTREGLYQEILHRDPPDIRKLNTRVPKDLAVIIQTAIAKDRERRYQTALDLADDLRRFRTFEPIKAKPVGPLTRVVRWAQRNRAVASLAAVLFISMSAGLIWIGIQNQRLREKTAEAEQSRDLAEESRYRADQVAGFQGNLLADLDAYAMGQALMSEFEKSLAAQLERRAHSAKEIEAKVALFRDLAVRAQPTDVVKQFLGSEILAPAADRIAADFGEDPATEAMLRDALAKAYKGLGLLKDAIAHQERAVFLCRQVWGEEHPNTLRALVTLGTIWGQVGRLPRGEALIRKALDGLTRTFGPEHEVTIWALGDLAGVLQSQDKFEEAREHSRVVLSRHRKVLGNTHPQTLTAITNLAALAANQGNLAEARQLFREALDVKEEMAEEDDPHMFALKSQLGRVLMSQGEVDEGKRLLRAAYRGQRRVHGATHHRTLDSLNALAGLLDEQGEFELAETLHREVLEARRKTLGDGHERTLESLINLALTLTSQGRLAEAESSTREAVEGLRRVLGAEHHETLSAIANLGLVLYHQRRYDEAETCCREALAGFRKQSGGARLDAVGLLGNLGAISQARGELLEAEKCFREAYEGMRAAFGLQHPGTLVALNNLGIMLFQQAKFAEAEPLVRELLKNTPAADPKYAEREELLADIRAGRKKKR